MINRKSWVASTEIKKWKTLLIALGFGFIKTFPVIFLI